LPWTPRVRVRVRLRLRVRVRVGLRVRLRVRLRATVPVSAFLDQSDKKDKYQGQCRQQELRTC